jgi:hypothetical protein
MKFISDTKWLSLITETYLEGLDAHIVQEHNLHIKLVNQPGAGDDQGEYDMDYGRLDH